MKKEAGESAKTDKGAQDYGIRELTTSLIRFTNAFTMFSMQQMQNVLGAVTDSQEVISRFCRGLDALSDALASQVDAAKKSTLDSMTRTGTEMMERTIDVMNVPALDPRNMMETTADLMRKTTDSVTDVLKKATAATSSGDGSAEPKNAAETLSRH